MIFKPRLKTCLNCCLFINIAPSYLTAMVKTKTEFRSSLGKEAKLVHFSDTPTVPPMASLYCGGLGQAAPKSGRAEWVCAQRCPLQRMWWNAVGGLRPSKTFTLLLPPSPF